MENNKETRMISSDEIFYAVLKDGTAVNNIMSLANFDNIERLVKLCEKLFNADIDTIKSLKDYNKTEQSILLILICFYLALESVKEQREKEKEELILKSKQTAEQ